MVKFTCLKKDIAKVISITEDIVAGKIVYNIESNVIFSLQGQTLTLMATDNSVWVKGELELQDAEGSGTVAVYAKIIGSIIREMPEGFLTVAIDDNNKIRIESENGRIHHTIIGMTPEDFPEYPTLEEGAMYIEVPTKEFVVMVNKCLSSVSKDTFRATLRGIYFEKDEKTFKAVSTDGKRLAYIERHFDDLATGDFDIIIEPKVLSEVLNVAAFEEIETLYIGVGSQQVYFKAGKYQFISTIVEGKFPTYRQVIPQDFDYSFRVNREDLLDAIKRVVPMISDVRSKRLVLEIKEGQVAVKGVNQEMGESVEEIEANYRGEPNIIAFNYAFVRDVVSQLESDIVTFRINDDNTPAMVKEIEREDYFYIIMPMKIDEEY